MPSAGIGPEPTAGRISTSCTGWRRPGACSSCPTRLYRVRYHAQSATSTFRSEPVRRYALSRQHVIDERFEGASPASLRSDSSAAGRLYLREAMRLWAGERPALLRELRFSDVREAPLRRAPLIAWGAWGRLSPATLRSALRLWIRARDARHARALPDGRPVEWRFG